MIKLNKKTYYFEVEAKALTAAATFTLISKTKITKKN